MKTGGGGDEPYVIRLLPVAIDDNEKLRFGEQVAREVRSLQDTEEEKAEGTARFGQRIKLHKHEISRLSDIVTTGREVRPVECEERRVDREVHLVRLDTEEIVSIRPMTAEERQMRLPLK